MRVQEKLLTTGTRHIKKSHQPSSVVLIRWHTLPLGGPSPFCFILLVLLFPSLSLSYG